jgi:GDP-L-fucose synthase
MNLLDYDSRIFVAGHNGMVGSSIVRKLNERGYTNILTAERADLDLTDQSAVSMFFGSSSIDCVVLAAAKVGGIKANSIFPADFIYDNIIIQANVINSSNANGIQDLLFLGSSCIYPKFSEQPISEESLLSGKLEATNEPYAIAKIAGIKLCESFNRQFGRNYRSIMPTNLYGLNDNFHPENSHVLPALIRKFHNAVSTESDIVTIWGSGKPKREFLHVDDLAEASLFVLGLDWSEISKNVDVMSSHINVGTGIDHSISEIVEMIAEISGFKGRIEYDTSQPDGTPRKLLDVSLISSLGWEHKIGVEGGIRSTYEWYCENYGKHREN